MFFTFLKVCKLRLLLKPQSRSLHKYVYTMNKAYLRHLEDRFEITFQYCDPAIKVNRQFNLCRQITETIASFKSRVATNVEKEIKKKTKNKTGVEPVEVSLILNNQPVDDGEIQCKDIFNERNSNQVVLKVSEQSFSVIINSPWVSALALPTSFLANFLVYPSKFDSCYTDKKLSQFTWSRSKDRKEWEAVGQTLIYQTTNSDIDFFLKLNCIPRNATSEGLEIEAISTDKVEASPGHCPFEFRHQFTKNQCENEKFRVVSYNILADLYCDSDYTREVLHPYCPAYALHIDYRKQLIVKELTGFNSDIICLQEVDRKIYNHDLKFIFDELGYDSNFCLKRDPVAEGLACFFNNRRFKLLEAFRFVPADEISMDPLFSDLWKEIEKIGALSERILSRSTVLQVLVLEALERDEILIVANTHLYFHPDADHIRLLQGGIVIRYIERLVETLKNRFKKRVSIIFCGDFNTVPECGIYQLFTTGNVQSDHIDFRSNPEQAINTVSLNQSIGLQSACGTPLYTNFTAGFAACLDYIFYEEANLAVDQVIPLPSVTELQQHTALPSIVFPSDHVSLVADLKWK